MTNIEHSASHGQPSLPGPDSVFSQNLRKGHFKLQRCEVENRFFFYPRVACPHCGSDKVVWCDVSGVGTIYSTTTVRQSPDKGGDYNVAIIELAEGPRLMSRVVNTAPNHIRIGLLVRAIIERESDPPVLLFAPAEPLS